MEFFDGEIIKPRMYPRALTNEEIIARSKDPCAVIKNPVACYVWGMWENSMSKIHDVSGDGDCYEKTDTERAKN